MEPLFCSNPLFCNAFEGFAGPPGAISEEFFNQKGLCNQIAPTQKGLVRAFDQSEQLKMLSPNVFAIGEDFGKQGVPEHGLALKYCEENNITVKRISRLKGISTSKIKSHIN